MCEKPTYILSIERIGTMWRWWNDFEFWELSVGLIICEKQVWSPTEIQRWVSVAQLRVVNPWRGENVVTAQINNATAACQSKRARRDGDKAGDSQEENVSILSCSRWRNIVHLLGNREYLSIVLLLWIKMSSLTTLKKKLSSNMLLAEAEVISEMHHWFGDHAGPTFDNNEMSVLFLGSNHPTEVDDPSIEEKYSTYHSNTYSICYILSFCLDSATALCHCSPNCDSAVFAAPASSSHKHVTLWSHHVMFVEFASPLP
jgi:hypothetical protein